MDTARESSGLDNGRIELRHDTDAAYWCRLFDVSPAQLRHAIQHVGPQAAAVRRYLTEHGHPVPQISAGT